MSAIGLRFLEAEFLKLRLYYLLDVRIAWVFPTKILMIFWRPTKRCCARVISVAIGFENDFCACPFDFSAAHVAVHRHKRWRSDIAFQCLVPGYRPRSDYALARRD